MRACALECVMHDRAVYSSLTRRTAPLEFPSRTGVACPSIQFLLHVLRNANRPSVRLLGGWAGRSDQFYLRVVVKANMCIYLYGARRSRVSRLAAFMISCGEGRNSCLRAALF